MILRTIHRFQMCVASFVLMSAFIANSTDASAELIWKHLHQDVVAGPGDELVPVRFECRNVGTAPIQVAGIFVACGCSNAVIEPNVVLPGETATLSLVADVTTVTGSRTFDLAVETGEKAPHRLSAQIFSPGSGFFEPSTLHWQEGGDSNAKKMRFLPFDSEGIAVERVDFDGHLISVSNVSPLTEGGVVFDVKPHKTDFPLAAKVYVIAKSGAGGVAKVYTTMVFCDGSPEIKVDSDPPQEPANKKAEEASQQSSGKLGLQGMLVVAAFGIFLVALTIVSICGNISNKCKCLLWIVLFGASIATLAFSSRNISDDGDPTPAQKGNEISRPESAISTVAASKRPKIVAANGWSFDFGNVAGVGKLTHRFVIRNAGDSELRLRSSGQGSGLITLRMKTTPILPGQDSIVEAELRLDGLRGPQNQFVEVETNDPSIPFVSFHMSGMTFAQ